jgi:LPXTG-motif cell wall-anchored protein
VSVEKSDLEAKLREIEDAVGETTGSAKTSVIVVVGVVLLLVLLFLFGKKRGKKGSARVEVYRLG